jgi:hypothetical protein
VAEEYHKRECGMTGYTPDEEEQEILKAVLGIEYQQK